VYVSTKLSEEVFSTFTIEFMVIVSVVEQAPKINITGTIKIKKHKNLNIFL